MDRAERMRQLKARAEVNRQTVEDASPVDVVTRVSHAVLDPEASNPRDDSSDVAARVAVGVADSLDLESLRNAGLDDPSPWFEIAGIVLGSFPPELHDSSHVWVSDMGSLFHRYNDCEIMWQGKKAAKDEGMKVHGVHAMKLSETRTVKGGYGHKLSACKVCI